MPLQRTLGALEDGLTDTAAGWNLLLWIGRAWMLVASNVVGSDGSKCAPAGMGPKRTSVNLRAVMGSHRLSFKCAQCSLSHWSYSLDPPLRELEIGGGSDLFADFE